MKYFIRYGALALSLIAGAALIAPPAEAGSVQRDGYFGGSWRPIGPRHNRYVQRYNRRSYDPSVYAYAGRRDYYGPGYYGPRGYYSSDYYDGPGYYGYGYGRRGGISVGIGF